MANKKHSCIICSKKVRPNTIACTRCLYKEENRKKLDIRTSADYSLKSNDFVLNAFAFLHACNQLEEFIEKVKDGIPSLLMDTWSDGPCVPEKLIDESTLNDYEFFSDHNKYRKIRLFGYSLKTTTRK